MNIRPTQSSIYNLVQSGLRSNQILLARGQEQIASGLRILRPSDGAADTASIFSLRRQMGGVERYLSAMGMSRPLIETATAALEDASGTLASAREVLIQGMNGTLSASDRKSLATEIELLRNELLDIANRRSGERYVFGGTETASNPFVERMVGGELRAYYEGDGQKLSVVAGVNVELDVAVPGSDLFANYTASGATVSGETGTAVGSSGSQGTGYERLELRTTGIVGALGAGLTVAASGHTILGDHTLTVDSTAGTVQLGSGPAVPIPAPGDPDLASFEVVNEFGSKLVVDFSGYTGADFSGSVEGQGEASLDGKTFVPLPLTETNFQVTNQETGAVVYLNTTNIHSAGTELVTFSGAVNAFDVLQGIADELRNVDGLDTAELQARLGMHLGELDRVSQDVRLGLSRLGTQSERLLDNMDRQENVQVQLAGLLSGVQDVDVTEAVLGMSKAEQALELAQLTGSRLIQTSLMNFLR